MSCFFGGATKLLENIAVVPAFRSARQPHNCRCYDSDRRCDDVPLLHAYRACTAMIRKGETSKVHVQLTTSE
jgi:hypothetical protein